MALSDKQTRRRLGRSVLAIAAGLVTGIVPSVGTDAVLHATGVFPPLGTPMSDALFVLAAGYRTVYGVLSSYAVARIAPRRPMTHVMLLGALGFVVSLVGAIVTWNAGPAFGPHWYPVSLVVLALPTAWLGGRLGVAGRADAA